jgi:hypothetical protein
MNNYDEELQPPTLNPNLLDFGTLQQGDSKTLPVMISNPGQKPMLWHVSLFETRWLSVDQEAGTVEPNLQQTVNVKVDTNSMVAGSYVATLAFTSEGDNSSASTQLPVMLTIAPDANSLLKDQLGIVVSPFAVGLSFVLNQNSSKTLPLAIMNRYSSVLNWVADNGGTNWINLDRIKGNLQPDEHQTIHVTANADTLDFLDYSATLTFTIEVAGTNSTGGQVQADLHVSPIPYGDNGPKAPIVKPNRLDFGTPQLPGNKASLTFTNTAINGIVDWAINTGGINWIQLDTSAGILAPGASQTINVTLMSMGLKAANSYQTDLILTFTFADPNKAGFEPTSVLVPATLIIP